MVKRIKLKFANLDVEFVDRHQAIKRVEEWAERGTYPVQVVYGPEGCGKTAWLKQSALILEELGFDVIYVDPINRDYMAYTGFRDVVKQLAEAASGVIGVAQLRLATLAVDLIKYILRMGGRRVAVLVDDAFQAIGLDKVAVYVKSLLSLIEYPPRDYERIVAVVTTSEGASRKEIGRHRWAILRPMWNMPKEGFKQLYAKIPIGKPSLEDSWRITGGNPGLLARLYNAGWHVDRVIEDIIREKQIQIFTASLTKEERELVYEAINDPDALMSREGVKLLGKLVELNLVVHELHKRDPGLWIDLPPPEKDLEIGIGRYVAWQTPLHKEALGRAIEKS